jgi:hypothetical protein
MANVIEKKESLIRNQKLGSSAAMFDLCRRTAQRAGRLSKLGRTKSSERMFGQLMRCQFAEINKCPCMEDCKRQLARLGAEPQDGSLTLFDWDRMGRREDGYVNLNGHTLRSGYEDLTAACDHWGNKIWSQKISTDVVNRHESRQMKSLLNMWQATALPSLETFDLAMLENEGILPWLHVNEVTSDGRTRAQHFAPNMVSITGKDYTGCCFEDHALEIFGEIHRQLFSDLEQAGDPIYTISARRQRLAYGKPSAMLRRLELPLFDCGKFSGSLVYLQPN